MNQPLDIAEINNNEKENKRLRALHTYGVVAPNGVISEHYCPPPDAGSDEGQHTGDTLLRWINGRPQVSKRWSDLGYVLYSDMAAADGEPEKAEMWKSAVSSRTMGLQVRGDVSLLYSRSVLERRRQYAAGSSGSGGKAFSIEAGGVVDDPNAAAEVLAKRIVEATGLQPELPGTDEKTARKAK